MFPFRFVDEAHSLKFSIDIDNKMNFTLKVNNKAFKDLPLRLYPIRVTDHGDVDDHKVQGLITLNGVELEFDRHMTSKWETEYFLQIIKDNLGDEPITSIFLEWKYGSNDTLNELLSVLYF